MNDESNKSRGEHTTESAEANAEAEAEGRGRQPSSAAKTDAEMDPPRQLTPLAEGEAELDFELSQEATAAVSPDHDHDDAAALLTPRQRPTKVDKAVSTTDMLEDLQRALAYEAVFSSLLEKKLLAIKHDCEERKRAKRQKRKSLGRILFSRKLFGVASGSGAGGLRKSASCRAELETVDQSSPLSTGDKRSKTAKKSLGARSRTVDDEIEIAVGSPIAEMAAGLRSQKNRSKPKTAIGAAAIAGSPSPAMITARPEVAAQQSPVADDSITSTLSTSSDRNVVGGRPSGKRNLLVQAQTHAPAEAVTSTTSSPTTDSRGEAAAGVHQGRSRLTAASISNGNGLPSPSLVEGAPYDTTSLTSGYENGAGARIHTSTMAEGSLTSIRDSIESLSFASSRCTVSFGGTEIIPEDTASLLYERERERVRLAKRLRILEAKSISAQCSPIFPRHVIKASPGEESFEATRIKGKASRGEQVQPPSIRMTSETLDAVPLTEIIIAPPPPPAVAVSTGTKQTQTKQRFLPNQVSYTDSMYGGQGETELEAAYNRYFSRQNTSEESANLTVSTLLNQSDSMSLHVPIYTSQARDAPTGTLSPGDRYKSKSANYLLGRYRPLPPPSLPQSTVVSPTAPESGTHAHAHAFLHPPQPRPPTEQLAQLSLAEPRNIIHSQHVVDSLDNTQLAGSTTAPVVGLTTPIAALTQNNGSVISTVSMPLRNGQLANGAVGVVAPSTAMPGDTARLNRMTSTSTGSSVAPTGCCATTKSSSRDREKQRFKPSVAGQLTGQSGGSDDEYRRRKRKYKRHHRCSDPVLVYPSPSGLDHCILSMPTNDPAPAYVYDEDFAYDLQLQMESEKMDDDDLEHIVPNSSQRRHHRHRHHKHKKRHRHKKPKILVQDLETQVVKVIDPDDLPQRARWTIIATACLLLIMCLMLVGITLRMAPIIDDMDMQNKFRQENERIMKESMERARLGKNFTDAASLMAAQAHYQATHHQPPPASWPQMQSPLAPDDDQQQIP